MILILHLDLDYSFADTIAAGHFHAGAVQLTGEEEDEPPLAQSAENGILAVLFADIRLVGFYLGWLGGEGKGRALGVGEVKFTGQVLPTAKKVTYRIHFKRIVNRRLIMGLADGEVLVDGRLIYTANDLKVGLFQDTSAF